MTRSSAPKTDIDLFFECDLWIPQRHVYMGGEDGVNADMAERVIKALTILETQGDSPIHILMDNVGGSAYHGLAIYDAIRSCKSNVTIAVFGHAMSMGSWILQAADSRHLMPNATVMIHHATWDGGGDLNWAQFASNAKEGKRLFELMCDHYLERIHEKHPTFTRTKLDKMLRDETYLTATEAVELGLADKVV